MPKVMDDIASLQEEIVKLKEKLKRNEIVAVISTLLLAGMVVALFFLK
jgi:hypothetical protein